MWFAHPERRESLQARFVDLLNRFKVLARYSGPQIVEGGIVIPFEESVAEWRDYFSIPETFRVLSELKGLRRRTQNELAEDFGKGPRHLLLDSLRSFDLIEPVRSEHNISEERYDAFSWTPIRIYLENPRVFRRELARLPEKSQWHEFLEARKTTSVDVQMALLMLITHNHLSEDFFIFTVATKEGLDEAWRAYVDLNRRYEHDESYWRSRIVSCSDEWASLYRESDVEFLEKRKRAVIELEPRGHRIPFWQRYHLYGAGILSHRLISELKIPKPAVAPIVKWGASVSESIRAGGSKA